MSRRGRRIKKQPLNQGKKIKVNESSAYKVDYPVFCFRHIHKDYSLDKCDVEDKGRLITRLHKLSQMSWREIQLAPKHGLGAEKIRKTSINPSIPAGITLSEDVTFLLALRYDGRKVIVGHRSGSIFHLLFIDHNFTVYDHG